MALNFQKAPVQPPVIEVARTKYGQLACGICKREPPLSPGVICAKCLATPNPPKEKK